MSDLDVRPWDWEAYTPKEEDEQLDFYKELCPKIATDVVYWCKYELDFTPWEHDLERRALIIEYMESKKLDPKIYYPNYGYGQLDGIRAMVDLNLIEVPISAGRRSGKTHSLYAATTFIPFRTFSIHNPPRSPMGVITCSHRREHAIDVIMSEIRSRIRYSKNVKYYVTNDSKMSIEFGAINSTIYSIPTSRYEQVKGYTNPLKIFMDESVLIRDMGVYNAIRPLLNQRGIVTLADGSKLEYIIGLVLTSTPEGMNNYFAQRFFLAQQGVKEGMKSLRWHSLDSPYCNWKGIVNELLEPNVDLLMWRQEYGAEFLYVANAFFEPELYDKNINWDLLKFGDKLPSSRPLYWGIDWGAVRDSTVVYIQEDLGNRIQFKYALEIRNTEYDKQIDIIVALAKILRPKIVKADSAGRAQNTILANKFGLPLSPVEGESMHLQNKHNMYIHAKYMMQYHAEHFPNTLLPPNPKMREQMIGINAEKSMGGVYLKFDDRHVGFDDWVDAYVLSSYCKPMIGGAWKPTVVLRETEGQGRRDFSDYRPVARVTGSPTRKTWSDRKRLLREEEKKWKRRKR